MLYNPAETSVGIGWCAVAANLLLCGFEPNPAECHPAAWESLIMNVSCVNI